MKLQIIETPDYILAVSDEDIKEDDCNLTNGEDVFDYTDVKNRYSLEYVNRYQQKITAYQPRGNAKELDLPLLPEIVIEDDVEKLAEKYANLKNSIHDYDEQYYNSHGVVIAKGFIEGYKSATKVYNEEDLRKVIELSRITYKEKTFGTVLPKYKPGEIVNLVTQPKTPKWFVAEHIGKCCGNQLINQCINCKKYKPQLKTTTIKGKTYLVGKYE